MKRKQLLPFITFCFACQNGFSQYQIPEFGANTITTCGGTITNAGAFTNGSLAILPAQPGKYVTVSFAGLLTIMY